MWITMAENGCGFAYHTLQLHPNLMTIDEMVSSLKEANEMNQWHRSLGGLAKDLVVEGKPNLQIYLQKGALSYAYPTQQWADWCFFFFFCNLSRMWFHGCWAGCKKTSYVLTTLGLLKVISRQCPEKWALDLILKSQFLCFLKHINSSPSKPITIVQ